MMDEDEDDYEDMDEDDEDEDQFEDEVCMSWYPFSLNDKAQFEFGVDRIRIRMAETRRIREGVNGGVVVLVPRITVPTWTQRNVSNSNRCP